MTNIWIWKEFDKSDIEMEIEIIEKEIEKGIETERNDIEV